MNVLPVSIAVNGASTSSRFLLLRLIILAAVALFLVWEVATRSLAAYFADARPETAIRLRSNEPIALLNLAEAKLAPVFAPSHQASQTSALSNPRGQATDPNGKSSAASTTEGDVSQSGTSASQVLAEGRGWSERTLRNDPLNARAFRILGLLSQEDNDERRTEALMQAALHRSLHESAAVYWLLQKSYLKQDYHAAIRYGDILLRTRSDAAPYVMPILGNIAENKDASRELKQLLATDPPWRSDFFASLPSNISDARTPLEYLLSLRNTSTPPTSADLRSYLNLLIDHKLYELAYYTWLQFLPPAQLIKVGRLFNGNFEAPPSESPFDWSFTHGTGVTVKVAARPDKDGDHALFMNFGGERVDTLDVRQLIWLAPGNYRFQGKESVDIVSQRGLRWHISCVNQAGTELGGSQTITGHAPAWSDFDFSFTVPQTACPAQYVWLNFDARWASEQFISGSIWFDDLTIVREQDVNQ